MLDIRPLHPPPLQEDFVPAALWNRAYRALVARDRGARPLTIALARADGTVSRIETRLLGASHPAASLNFQYAERLLKFLLWQRGASRVLVAGAGEICGALAGTYSAAGDRAFDHAFMGSTIDGREFELRAAELAELPEPTTAARPLGGQLDGCRIGFDLGGSDRKAAAVIDGHVVFSEEVPWNPYFQSDPAYHIEGVHDSLRRAAAHLPRIDAIGGSAAGVYVNNEVRAGSLFRGVPPELFETHVRRMFFALQERWGGVPFVVANDGDVTALAGAMTLGEGAVLGVSMGTSQAGGYINPEGGITPWLNELAFAPIDYEAAAPRDEWSGDRGCGVQYFSQQGVARLARAAGFDFAADLPADRQLAAVQAALADGDQQARRVFDAIGTMFGYALAHYAEFYAVRHVLVLGRVSSGPAGEIIVSRAAAVLQAEFPELAEGIRLHLPDEKAKRHGQAIAAASLPALRGSALHTP